jgi:hypothetical protein
MMSLSNRFSLMRAMARPDSAARRSRIARPWEKRHVAAAAATAVTMVPSAAGICDGVVAKHTQAEAIQPPEA